LLLAIVPLPPRFLLSVIGQDYVVGFLFLGFISSIVSWYAIIKKTMQDKNITPIKMFVSTSDIKKGKKEDLITSRW
jgi:hypothetical protein